MNLNTRTFDTPSTVGRDRGSQSVIAPLRDDSSCPFAMSLPEIAVNLGTSLADVVLLEQRAITKAKAWARKNGYPLEDLLGISNHEQSVAKMMAPLMRHRGTKE